MLADAVTPSSYQSIGWLLVSLGALALIANQLLAFVRNLRGPSPQPPNNELELAGQQLEMRVSELERNREEDRKQASERRKAIYEQMNRDRETFMQEVRNLYARIERNEVHINETIRQLPHEIIATLRNTGVIK